MLHTVLLRNDGTAVACGENRFEQCNLPALDEGLTYTQVAAGGFHTVLLRSDGTAVACGRNDDEQCSLPALDEGLTYTRSQTHSIVLQAWFHGGSMHFVTLNGEELCRIETTPTDRLVDIFRHLITEIGAMACKVVVVFPGGEVLSEILSKEPSVTVSGCSSCI